MLLTHILAASITLILCLYALIRPSTSLRFGLRFVTTLSVLSGIFLANDPAISARVFCVKLGIYLLIVAMAEYVLHKKLVATISK